MATLFALAYARSALASLRRIQPKKAKRQIINRINDLMLDPYPVGSVRMQGVMNGTQHVFRVRSGDYRILYCQNGECEVFVLDIGHRKDVYRNR